MEADPWVDGIVGYFLSSSMISCANGFLNLNALFLLHGTIIFALTYVYHKEMHPVILAEQRAKE